MLVTMKDILKIAEERHSAVGAFNAPNLECVMAVLQAAEKENEPVMLTHAEVHEEIMPINIIGPILIDMAKKASVPVCVHLDHGETLEYLEKALKLGFTSIMYDGSLLPYDENVENTKRAVELARKYGASVEAEIGILGGRESGSKSDLKIDDMYTEPEEAKRFVEATGIDALAASFGTAHGFYKTKPKLDFERIKKIKELVNIPLVMHGGSGLSAEDYITAINHGIRKINYYSYMSKTGVEAVKKLLEENQVNFYLELVKAAVESMEADARRAIKIFANR